MYYYAQISPIGYVMKVHALDAPSTNENYIAITEDQYTNGNLVGRYYNKLTGAFTLIENGMYLGSDNEVRHKLTYMPLSTRVDNLQYDINQKAELDHTHTEYAEVTHTHSEYALSSHSHDDYATVIALDTLDEKVDGKADTTHTHNEYALSAHEHDNYALSNHDHDTIYAPISHSHNEYVTTTDFNALETEVSGKANTSHTHDDRYYTETEIDTLLSGKANSSHTHTISNITNLQSTLDGKAATSHGAHVSFSTTAPVMDGSASVGTATTVARSDHKHPIDTSRAAQTSLDSHTGNKSNPHSVTLAQLGLTATAAELNKMDGVTATTAELNILDGITATTAELNYVDGVTSNIQTQLNGKAASGHTHGAATTSAAGFMTAAMVTKLNGIATGANAYAHPTYTARTGVPTANQTPAFGGTFTVSQPVSDGTGHITAVNSRTITIPNAVVTTSANGLMSASDKSKLDGIVLATVSEVETYLAI